MICRDLPLKSVHSCAEGDTVQQCATLMRDLNVGFIPILDDQKRVVGAVTDRDIAIRIAAEGRPLSTKVSEVMTLPPLLTCNLDEDLRDVEARMGHEGKSRVIILDDEKRCVGVLSLSDIARVEEQARAGQLLYDVTGRESHAPVLEP